MSNRYIYQLTETLITNSSTFETVEHDLGIFRSLTMAENILMRQIIIYSPDGKLQISEFNLFGGGGAINKRLNLCTRISVDISPNKKYYFTLYNNWRRELATKCARISFLEPKYELGSTYNKSIWFLDDNEKRMFMEFLKIKRPYASDNEPSNNWQCVIRAFNNKIRDEAYRILPYNTPIPDYTKLEP